MGQAIPITPTDVIVKLATPLSRYGPDQLAGGIVFCHTHYCIIAHDFFNATRAMVMGDSLSSRDPFWRP